jgi:hypothetical protein
MTAESDSNRRQQWELVVRRSFGIPDVVPNEDVRRALIGRFEDQLRENGWQSPTRAIAEPIVDILMLLGAIGDPDDDLLLAELRLSAESSTTSDTANRFLDRGVTLIDPEHLVFGVGGEYPPEVVAAVQQALSRVGRCMREEPFGI